MKLTLKPLTVLMTKMVKLACTLSAFNWGNIKTPEDFEKPRTLAVRALDALLDYPEVSRY